MTWGEESAGSSDKFQPTPLDPAKARDLERTAVLGVGLATPNVEPQGEAGAGNFEASQGRGAWRRRLAPHHRRAVKNFFSAGKNEND